MQERKIQARYEGRCTQCQGAVRSGDWVYWNIETRAVRHADCEAARARHEKLDAERAWREARRAEREQRATAQPQQPAAHRRGEPDPRWERMSYSQRVAHARALNARFWARLNRESMPDWYVYEKDAK